MIALASVLTFFIITINTATPALFEKAATITTDTVIDGDFKSYRFGLPITIAPHCSVTIQNCVVTEIDSTSFILQDVSSELILSNTSFILTNDVAWLQGKLTIKNCCRISQNYCWHYASTAPLTIKKHSCLLLTNGCTLYYFPKTPNNTTLKFIDKSSLLSLVNSTLRCGPYGLVLTKGSIIINEECSFLPDSSDPRAGIYLGSGHSSADNTSLELISSSAKLKVIRPHLYEKKCPTSFIQKTLSALNDNLPFLIAAGGIYALCSISNNHE